MLKHPEEANSYENGMDYKRCPLLEGKPDIFRTCAHGFERIHGSAKEKDRNHDGTDITMDEYMDRDQDLLLVNSIWRKKISIVNFRIMFQRSFLSLAAFFRFWGWVTRLETWVVPCHTLLHFNLQARHGGRARWIRSWISPSICFTASAWGVTTMSSVSNVENCCVFDRMIFDFLQTQHHPYQLQIGDLFRPTCHHWTRKLATSCGELSLWCQGNWGRIGSKDLGDAAWSKPFGGSPDPRCFLILISKVISRHVDTPEVPWFRDLWYPHWLWSSVFFGPNSQERCCDRVNQNTTVLKWYNFQCSLKPDFQGYSQAATNHPNTHGRVLKRQLALQV